MIACSIFKQAREGASSGKANTRQRPGQRMAFRTVNMSAEEELLSRVRRQSRRSQIVHLSPEIAGQLHPGSFERRDECLPFHIHLPPHFVWHPVLRRNSRKHMEMHRQTGKLLGDFCREPGGASNIPSEMPETRAKTESGANEASSARALFQVINWGRMKDGLSILPRVWQSAPSSPARSRRGRRQR